MYHCPAQFTVSWLKHAVLSDLGAVVSTMRDGLPRCEEGVDEVFTHNYGRQRTRNAAVCTPQEHAQGSFPGRSLAPLELGTVCIAGDCTHMVTHKPGLNPLDLRSVGSYAFILQHMRRSVASITVLGADASRTKHSVHAAITKRMLKAKPWAQ